MGPGLGCARGADPCRDCAIYSPTASIVASSCSRPSPTAGRGPSKSSSAQRASKASNCCPEDGSSNAPSPGSADARSEEHTSELQSLMRTSYAVFCLKKKNNNKQNL